MSDGISDMYRDERRGRNYAEFLNTIAKYVTTYEDPETDIDFKTSEGRLRKAVHQEVLEAAKSVDEIPRGLFGGQTNLAAGVHDMLMSFNKGNQRLAWLLWELHEHGCDSSYKAVLNESPWAGKQIGFVSFNHFDSDKGIAQMLKKPLKDAGKATTFSGNPEGYFEYVIFYDENMTLAQIAKNALLFNTKVTSYYPGSERAYILPTSSDIKYLEQRKEMLQGK